MKRLLALLIGCSCLKAKSIVTDELVDKFAIIESNYNHEAVGDGGKALGAWQMHKAAVYESVTNLYRRTGTDLRGRYFDFTFNMKFMKEPVISRMLAKEYMCILEKQFTTLKVKVTPIKLYMAWNMGFSGAKNYDFNINSYALDGKRTSILKRANYILSR
jgi:hypothetical protein